MPKAPEPRPLGGTCFFGSVLAGSGGYPQGARGVWAPGWQIAGTPLPPNTCLARFAVLGEYPQAGSRTPGWQRSGRVRGDFRPSVLQQVPVLQVLGTRAFDRVREAKCLLGTLASRRAAGTGREDPQPDSNPSQLRFAVKPAELRGEAESKKAPLEGVSG